MPNDSDKTERHDHLCADLNKYNNKNTKEHGTSHLRILKSAAVLGLFISFPTRGGVGSERRTAEGLTGRRLAFLGGDGE